MTRRVKLIFHINPYTSSYYEKKAKERERGRGKGESAGGQLMWMWREMEGEGVWVKGKGEREPVLVYGKIESFNSNFLSCLYFQSHLVSPQ